MTEITWKSGGGVIQHVEAKMIPPLDLPAGADLIQRNGTPEFHVTLIGRKTLIGHDTLLQASWPQVAASLAVPPRVKLSAVLYEASDEGRRTWFLHVENQNEIQEFVRTLNKAISSVSGKMFENPETDRYFHVSVANHAGGDPLRSIGSIRRPRQRTSPA